MAFLEHKCNGVTYMTSPNIETVHAFTTRHTGVSQGIYHSLNLGQNTGDDGASVSENYNILGRALHISSDDIVSTRQVHGNHVRVVAKNDRGRLYFPQQQDADGIITNEPNIALMILVADCVPILLHDPVLNLIGAVHSGWRGTAMDIAGSAIKKMSEVFGSSPANIRAAVGPCISQCCYETDSDVPDGLFKTLQKDTEKCIKARDDKYMVDLKEANHLLLRRAGLSDIMVSDECTSCRNDKYWSHRKTKGQRGSQAAIIQLRNQNAEMKNS